MNEQDIYKKALAKWGLVTQVMMAMGECGELSAELNRFYNQKKSSEEKVIDEIADVEIMLGQLRYVLGSERVDKAKQEKLKRLVKIMDGSTYHPHQ